MWWVYQKHYIDGLVQDTPNAIANAVKLRLSYTDTST